MRRWVFGVVVCLVVAPQAAWADDHTDVNTTQAGLGVGANNQVNVPVPAPIDGPPLVHVSTTVDVGTETAEQFCAGINWSEGCLPPEEGGQVLTGGEVAQAFQFVPLPSSTLIIQPPNGRTLVNFETNFYTDAAEEMLIPVPILDRVVELRVWPAQFTWNFGDGKSLRTTERGAAYPALDITHKYLHKGEVAPSLDTTYAAEWRLQGQGESAWQPVRGTVTIEGAPAALQVLTATPTLAG